MTVTSLASQPGNPEGTVGCMANPDITKVTATPDPADVIEYLRQTLSDAQMTAATLSAGLRAVSNELVAEREKVRDLTVQLDATPA